jgi:valyl-tRNA synthetase
LSDLEVEHEEHNGHLWRIRYPAANGGPGVVVATTRPETMLGDTAVAVNPNDPRYKDLIGQTVMLPLMDRPIPVIADEYVDMEFGTGALKVTPGHDPNDLLLGERHNLPSINVIGPDGTMTAEAGRFAGLDRYECRKQVETALEERGLLEGIDAYRHQVGQCSRCDTIVEPLVSTQWFVRMAPLAKEGLEAVRNGKVTFVPERWTKVYCDWLENIQDWCISRQLWWGHSIPVWYCDDCREQICTREDPTGCPHCGGTNLRQDEDVLDTWFSSALWPFSTLGWPDDTPELHYFYPTTVLVTGYDIIYFWVARMVMMGIHLRHEEPFGKVFIHGLVRDETGRKMSKSIGNAVDPIELMDQYGADAMRFALTQLITHGQDLTLNRHPLDPKDASKGYEYPKVLGARNFCNKIWNASRFVMMNVPYPPAPLPGREGETDTLPWGDLAIADRWILSRLLNVLNAVHRHLSSYNLAQAADALYDFIWTEFCDWYLELSKTALYGDDPVRKAAVQAVLRRVLGDVLKALHPFMPFITEEIWQRLEPKAESLAIQPYPTGTDLCADADAEQRLGEMQQIVTAIRALRADFNIPPGQRLAVTLIPSDTYALDAYEKQRAGMIALGAVSDLHLVGPDAPRPRGAASTVAAGTHIFLHLHGAVDPMKEMKRLEKRIEGLEGEAQKCNSKLMNEGFTKRAPAEVVERERQRVDDIHATIAKLQEQFDTFAELNG